MIRIAIGIANDINKTGAACRFMTVDADTHNNPTVVDFYKKNGFKLNMVCFINSSNISSSDSMTPTTGVFFVP